MSSGIKDLNELIQQKQDILNKKKSIDKNDVEAVKDLNLQYMRVQKKIQYYSNEEYRKDKINKTKEHNKFNDKYNEYQREYQKFSYMKQQYLKRGLITV